MFRLFGKRCSIEPLMNTSSSLASRPFRRRSRKPSKRAASSGISFCAISQDRKSTRLNSSHLVISYAVFCLKKKKNYHLDHCSRLTTLAFLSSDPALRSVPISHITSRYHCKCQHRYLQMLHLSRHPLSLLLI